MSSARLVRRGPSAYLIYRKEGGLLIFGLVICVCFGKLTLFWYWICIALHCLAYDLDGRDSRPLALMHSPALNDGLKEVFYLV